MQVLVTFRHIEATDALRDHAQQKVEHASKFLRDPIEAHVVLSVIKRRHIAEITLTGSHLALNATEETKDLYSAIDLATSKIERQIKKHVTKRKSRKHAAQPREVVATSPPRQSRARIKTESLVVEPMAVREAVKQLEASDTGFVIFQNTASDLLSILCRGKNGSYRLIEPEGFER
jgi:putative sigma-54 modulation protein